MGVSIPIILEDEWYNFVENGLTRPIHVVYMDPPIYDGDQVIPQPQNIEGPIDAVWLDFKISMSRASLAKADDSTTLFVDKKVIFPALELPVTPRLTDKVVDDSNNEWSIIGIETDPARAHYTFHIRPLKMA
jgi:hypothetical protein